MQKPTKKQKTPPATAGEKNESEPSWPVAKGSELTLAHVPQKLRDEISRPHIARAKRLGQALLEYNDSLNDLRSQVGNTLKASNKDGQRLQGISNGLRTAEDLAAVGLVRAQKEAPADA